MTNFDALWNFNDPTATEQKFRELLPEFADQPAQLAELLTQIARTQGLQRHFEGAHATLEEARSLAHPGSRSEVRYFLELGRVYRSSNKSAQAKPCFENAYQLSSALNEDALTVDAAHMIALVTSSDEARQWNERALELARISSDPKAQAWKASLLNNIGWDLHAAGAFTAALERFEETVTLHTENPERQFVARWSVARTLRSLERTEEALQIQRGLLQILESTGATDGYVNEEIAENLLLLDDSEAAAAQFGEAFELLSKDAWLSESEPERLERLKRLSIPED
jgi:hypothetical protein